jgi:hypothetical protein
MSTDFSIRHIRPACNEIHCSSLFSFRYKMLLIWVHIAAMDAHTLASDVGDVHRFNFRSKRFNLYRKDFTMDCFEEIPLFCNLSGGVIFWFPYCICL